MALVIKYKAKMEARGRREEMMIETLARIFLSVLSLYSYMPISLGSCKDIRPSPLVQEDRGAYSFAFDKVPMIKWVQLIEKPHAEGVCVLSSREGNQIVFTLALVIYPPGRIIGWL